MKCQPQFASSLPSGRYELDMLGATAIATQWRRNFADRRDAMLSKVNWGPLCIAATGASGLRSQSATHMAEYLRPWKLFSLACGTGLLIAGAYHYEAPDWDVPISLLMASLAYLTAPWSMRVMLERQWKKWPAMLFATWFTVDGIYWLYWRFKDPVALEFMREANFPASLSLYWICGVIWLYRGSLSELHSEARRVLSRSSAPSS